VTRWVFLKPTWYQTLRMAPAPEKLTASLHEEILIAVAFV